MWRSDEGVAPYGCLYQPKHTDQPKSKEWLNSYTQI